MKKLICLILAVLMVIPLAAAAEDETSYTYDSSISFVMKLDIMTLQNGDFMPDGGVTRADFAKIICKMLNLDTNLAADTEILDVAEDYWAVSYIKTCIQMGYMSLTKSSSFWPEEEISYIDAVNVLIDILGYRQTANAKGTYPAGDWAQAKETGLLKKLSGSIDTMITRAEMAQLCYNAMTADMMIQKSYGSKLEYYVDKNADIFTEYWHLTAGEGRIIQNDKTSLQSTKAAPKGQVNIGGEMFKEGATGASQFLGYYVKYYYDSSDTLIYTENMKKPQTVTVEAELADSVDGDYFYYYKVKNEDKKLKLRISREADVIYNEVALYDYNKNDILPKTGNIEFLDYDGDDVYDVVFVHEYNDCIAGNIYKEKSILNDSAAGRQIDFSSDTRSSVSIMQYNKEKGIYTNLALSKIKKDSVVSVMESRDMSVITALVSSEQISGVVSSIDEENDEIVINGETYKLSNTYKENMQNGFADRLEVGAMGEFYLNVYGLVAHGKLTDSMEYYGFMSECEAEDGISSAVQFRILTKDGWNNYDCIDKVTLKGADTTKEELLSTFRLKPQVVRFKVNAEGKIKNIDAYVDKTREEGYIGYTDDVFTKDASLGSAYYKTGTYYFNKQYSVSDKNTVIFSVPSGAVADGKVNEEDITVVKTAVFVKDQRYSVEVYDSNEYRQAAVLVWNNEYKDYERNLFFVNRRKPAVKEDGTTTYAIEGYHTGSKKTYLCKNMDMAKDVVPGDVLQFILSQNKEIIVLNRVCTRYKKNAAGIPSMEVNAELSFGTTTSMTNSTYAAFIGSVYTIDGSIFVLRTVSPSAMWQFQGGGVNVLRFNDEKNVYEKGELTSVRSEKYFPDNPTRMFIHDRYSETKDIVILE